MKPHVATSSFELARFVLVMMLAVFGIVTTGPALAFQGRPASLGTYPETAQRLLTEADLRGLSRNEISIMKSEIYARNGYEFHQNDATINYFARQTWYRAIPNKTRNENLVWSRMSAIEQANVNFLSRADQTPPDDSGETRPINLQATAPGDLERWYPEASERRLTEADTRTMSRQELSIMRNEIFAVNGYQLHQNPSIVRHFEQQQWYHHIPNKTENTELVQSRMSTIERANVEFLLKMEKKAPDVERTTLRVERTTPGNAEKPRSSSERMYPEASTRALTEADIEGLSPEETRIIKGEIFAVHGYELHLSSAMVDHFERQAWYRDIDNKTRNADLVWTRMSDIEHRNVAFLTGNEWRDDPPGVRPTTQVGVVIQEVESYLGALYKWGGETRQRIDCSALMQNGYKVEGIWIPRNSRQQAAFSEGDDVANISDLLPGDLVFFPGSDPWGTSYSIGHVGMVTDVTDKGVRFIHSSSNNGGVAYNYLSRSSRKTAWGRKFVKGKRIIF